MPYPDHFNPLEYGINEVIWTVSCKLLKAWSKSIVESIFKTPVIIRTSIEMYNATKESICLI